MFKIRLDKNITLVLNVLFGLILFLLPTGHPVGLAQTDESPLELSGLSFIWEENFTDGSIDRMQYTWAKGDHSALTSHIMPGAVYLGHKGGTVEQQINNFKAYDGEPLPSTIEFDVLNPVGENARVSLRPRRRSDFAHIYVGNPGNETRVNFTFNDVSASILYNEETGPSFGWAHVTVSYRQYVSGDTTYAHYVVAINEEVHEYHAPSSIIDPDWLTHWNTTPDATGWSIEYHSAILTMGRYIARIKAYQEFLTRSEMESRLQGRVVNYLGSLPDPRDYGGSTKAFQGHKDLDLYGPNAMAYAEQMEALTVRFDASLSSSWGKITSYDWTFGDGNSASGRIVNHTYAQPGTFEAELVVSNDYGAESRTIPVTVQGVSVGSNQSAFALPASQVIFTHTLTNLSDTVGSFYLTAIPGLPGWSAVVSSPNIGPIAPAESVSFTVTVQVPLEAAVDSIGVVTVLARLQADPLIEDTTTDTITVVGELPPEPEPITGLVIRNDGPTLLEEMTTLTATVSSGSEVSYAWDFGDGSALLTTPVAVVTHTYSATGIYMVTVIASNSVGAVTEATTVTVTLPQGVQTLEVRVMEGTDDAEESPSGDVSLMSSDLELVYDRGDQTVGVRFAGVEIPQGATILDAYVQFQVDETSTGVTSLTIEGQAGDNAAAFTYSTRNISSRARTSASVLWSPVAWTTVGAAGPDQQTSNLSSIIQEIVNRSGWSSGNALVLIITGSGERGAESYNGSQSGAPLLHIEYCLD
jgi:PKD repeat protein